MMPGHGIDLVVAVDLECGYLAKVFFFWRGGETYKAFLSWTVGTSTT